MQYYIPEESPWPFVGSIALILLVLGVVGLFQDLVFGWWFFIGGTLLLVFMLYHWFSNILTENAKGLYSAQMETSFRWGMGWFIFSEIMFFAAFFGALFYARVFSVPWLGGEGDKAISHMLWPQFKAIWPLLNAPNTALFPPIKEAMSPFPLPTLNTLILLISGITLTIAHFALKAIHRKKLILFLGLTVLLGFSFLCIQACEYYHAYDALGITLGSGIYGTTFFVLTGFHGAHVCIGSVMLGVMLARSLQGHFTPDNHFAFEAAAWYWHFVDVVWLFLFVFVYWL